MTTSAMRGGGERHPAALSLERFATGELGPGERARLELHLAACPRCRTEVAAVDADRQALLLRLPPDRFVAALEDRQARHWWRLAGAGSLGLVAAAAAAWLVAAPPRSALRAKGIGLVVHLQRGESVRRLGEEETIQAGDALRVALSLPRPARVTAWFADAQGQVEALAPEGPAALAAGEQLLPGSVVVDAPCRDLVLVVGVGEAASPATLAALRQRPGALPPGTIGRRLRCR